MRPHLTIFALAVSAAAFAAAPASAAIMLATWSTTISRVGEPQKIIGGPGEVGTPFVLSLKYDTTLGEDSAIKEPGEISHSISTDRTQPLLAASATFGGKTLTFDLAKADWVLTQGAAERFPAFALTRLEAFTDIGDTSYALSLNLRAIAGAGAIPFNFDVPFSTSSLGGGSIVFKPAGAGGEALELTLGSDEANPGRLDVVRLDTAPGVPEPAAWALMILGFGVAGVSLRRRQAAKAAGR